MSRALVVLPSCSLGKMRQQERGVCVQVPSCIHDGGSEMTGDASAVLDGAVFELESHAHEQTDGVWLEVLTAEVAPHIRDWNIGECWRWSEWPDRDEVMPQGTPSVDVGIDLVARRRDDGKWVAIQAKARRLDAMGEGAPVKLVNVAQAVERQRAALIAASEFDQSPHGGAGAGHQPAGDGERFSQTRSDMQREAVELAVKRLRDNEQADEVGIPRGEARGRIVLPCGAGKTRIALRIVEELTYQGELSVVLCPSIALVAQIRREFLEHTELSLRSMAVCSDQGVAADEEKVANADDATLDRGLETVEALKGCPVTTDPSEIADWIRERRTRPASEMVSVIFGTYQSARRVSEGIKQADAADAFKVLICDEAHRTAGVRRRKRSTSADVLLSDFTLCHDRDAFPATYRVYQTATPRIYGDSALAEAAGRSDKGDFLVRHMDDQSVFGVELYRRSNVDAVSNGWLSDYRIIAMGIGDQAAIDLANLLVRQADEEAAREAEEAATGGKKPMSRSRRGETPPGQSHCRQSACRSQCRDIRRGHRLPIAVRCCLPGAAQVLHRRGSSSGKGDAPRSGQRPRVHRGPCGHPPRRGR